MHFLADERCDFSVVRALRDSGHDVVAVAESLRGTSDEQVIELAQTAKRILITEDKDFGSWYSLPRRKPPMCLSSDSLRPRAADWSQQLWTCWRVTANRCSGASPSSSLGAFE